MKCPKCGVTERGKDRKKNVVIYKTDDFDTFRKRYKVCKRCHGAYTTTESVD